ncbi:molecular chaperone [Sphingomonas crusticola]|uniref:molecular chaperone n=1 Tax=Sphingomonas crusticola TaxID=1697973 RepID=UPI0013C2B5EA|nr:molecular chaperone [Sphingomonas crusticola]
MIKHSVAVNKYGGLRFWVAVALAFAGVSVVTSPATAQTANVTPKRLVFSRPGQAATVFVFNQGSTPGVFDITLVDRVMTPSGEIKPLGDGTPAPEIAAIAPKLQSAAKMMIVTPRRVTLQPGKGQTIRIRAIAPADLPAGEYRTHLTVAALPPPDQGFTPAEAANGARGELAFRVNTIMGVSIPLIVRQGPADVKASFANPRISSEMLPAEAGIPAHQAAVLDIDLVRGGSSSLFGDVDIRSADAKRGPLAQMRGVGVYTEIDRRHLKMVLARVPSPGEQLTIVFKDDDQSPGTELAKATFPAS